MNAWRFFILNVIYVNGCNITSPEYPYIFIVSYCKFIQVLHPNASRYHVS